ncbi:MULTISPECIES: Imm2 family immunity protein [Pectobacterium]|uniref:Imm2 family immunity protein n=1 Tax=Pectobacterium TaxID=122277 RepID=UPI00188951DD|nr:Imm2 family immunity protein [Pectobacterium carotovorum]
MRHIYYKEIKESFLIKYYDCCRNMIFVKNKGKEIENIYFQEIGYAYDQAEGSYYLPIENLMLEVLSLIMIAGRGPEKAEKYHREMIEKILVEHPLEQLLEEIAEEEKSDLLYDMSLLGLIDKKSE